MSGALTHGPADIVGHLLLGIPGAALTDPADNLAWPLSISEELASPDNVVSIFDTEGDQQGSEHTAGEIQEQEGIMIRVRARDYQTGFEKAHALAIILDQGVSYDTTTVGSTDYIVHSINRTSGVIHVGRETGASKRHLFTINAVVALTQR